MSCFSFRAFLCISIFAGMTACRPAPAPENTPLPEVPNPSTTTSVDRATRSWIINPVTALRHYRATTVTTLELGNTRDSIISTTVLTIAIHQAEASVDFSGTIDSVRIQPGEHTGGTQISSATPSAFAGQFRDGMISLQPALQCDSNTVPFTSLAQRLIALLPPQLHTGMTWTDSVAVTTCSGNIPVSVKSIQDFRVVGESTSGSGSPAILIKRDDRSTSSGDGIQDGHHVQLTGTTTSSAKILIDPATGALLHLLSQAGGTVAVTASGRTQVFRQTVRSEIIAQ